MLANLFKQLIAIVMLTVFLSACDSGGGVAPDVTPPEKPVITQVDTDANGKVTIAGRAEKNSTVTVTFPDGTIGTATADENGDFSITSASSQPDGNIEITSKDNAGNSSPASTVAYDDNTAPLAPTSTIASKSDEDKLIISGVTEPKATVTVTFADGSQENTVADKNGHFILQSELAQQNNQTTIRSTDTAGNTSSPVTTGMMPVLSYKPSLGMNTEQSQGDSDGVAVPMPFVDIFRTARPFPEFAKKLKKDVHGNPILDLDGKVIYIDATTTFDTNGWPTSLDPDLNSTAKTKLLQGSLNHSIPSGTYTILYEGEGYIEFGSHGPTSNHQKLVDDHKDTVELTLRDVITAETNAINMNIKGVTTGEGNYLKNIRMIMPGGTCAGNPFVRVNSQLDCPNNTTFESFEERLQNDRNAIIFNPDYLLFMREFKVIRMMNLMEASLKHTCLSEATCPANLGTWSDRAKMDDAVWGGSARTPYDDHKGVAIEVVVALANAVKRDIWINIPHFAKNDYVSNLAQYVFDNLDSSLNVYIEYSNEVWNSGFAGHNYVTTKGLSQNLGTVPANFIGTNRDDPNYFARLRYYSKRSVEIFDIWKSKFGASSTRLERILGSFIGDKILTEQMIKYVNDEIGQDKIDAIAIAPYFFGCINRSSCPNATTTLLEATTVDDIFTAINETASNDVKSLNGVLKTMRDFQLQPIKDHNTNSVNKISLLTYEGGQHLVVNTLPEADRDRVRPLFNQANRDTRMKEAYEKLLNQWKTMASDGAALFTLYTVPRTNSDYGDFGLKEHLNKSRAESPKYDGVMTFQEAVGKCWWDDCE